MAHNDPDNCVPQTLTDFVFDLYDSVTLSQLSEEQSRLYNVVFRDLSKKYFANTTWPSPQSIASECNGDPLFLAFYRELTHRHWHAVSRPTLRDRMEGWEVYRDLLDELLETAEEEAFSVHSQGNPKLFLVPQWAFDILHEFVYQFQGFCQFRTTLYASAHKHHLLGSGNGNDNEEPNPKAPHHVVENVALLQESVESVWNAETVWTYLHRLVAIGTSPKCTVPAYQYFGTFASVALSRLECLLQDYTGSLQALTPLQSTTVTVLVQQPGQATETLGQVVESVFAARLSMVYHAGVSFFMLRRYKDAIAVLAPLCLYMQRGFKTGQLRKLPGSDQYFKNYDRMLALLATATHLCPSAVLEESLVKAIREKHGSALAKDALGDLFGLWSPKCVSPRSPDFTHGAPWIPTENAYQHQLRLFQDEVSCHKRFRQLLSYLKLYTTMDVSKLVSFGNDEWTLVQLKQALHQVTGAMPTVAAVDNAAATSAATAIPSLTDTKRQSALDISYHVEGTTVHIDAAEKERRYENYFLGQMVQSHDIRKEVHGISTNV